MKIKYLLLTLLLACSFNEKKGEIPGREYFYIELAKNRLMQEEKWKEVEQYSSTYLLINSSSGLSDRFDSSFQLSNYVDGLNQRYSADISFWKKCQYFKNLSPLLSDTATFVLSRLFSLPLQQYAYHYTCLPNDRSSNYLLSVVQDLQDKSLLKLIYLGDNRENDDASLFYRRADNLPSHLYLEQFLAMRHRPIIAILEKPFAGKFSSMIYRQGNSWHNSWKRKSLDLSPYLHCAFFSQQADEDDFPIYDNERLVPYHQSYLFYFLQASTDKIDFNGDGITSAIEAHYYAFMQQNSAHVPMTTKDRLIFDFTEDLNIDDHSIYNILREAKVDGLPPAQQEAWTYFRNYLQDHSFTTAEQLQEEIYRRREEIDKNNDAIELWRISLANRLNVYQEQIPLGLIYNKVAKRISYKKEDPEISRIVRHNPNLWVDMIKKREPSFNKYFQLWQNNLRLEEELAQKELLFNKWRRANYLVRAVLAERKLIKEQNGPVLSKLSSLDRCQNLPFID